MSYQNRVIFFLNSCIYPSHIHQIQSQIIVRNLQRCFNVAHLFVNACHSSGLLNHAYLLLCRLPEPHVFVFNNLIRAFSHSKIPHIPFSIYTHMHENSVSPNNFTFPFLFKSLADFHELRLGQMIHNHIIKLGHVDDIYVRNSLLSVYASCGKMGLCRKVFDEMRQRDVVSWTVLITGYRGVKKYDDALIAFEQMQYAGVEPNRVTMVNALAACASYGAPEMGVWIHDFIKRRGWELDVILGTALVDMYAKCGWAEEALSVFRSMKEKNVYTWNAVINGLALAKSGKEAVWCFNRMEQEGFKADEVTLVEVLSACSHSGLVDTGRQIFTSLGEGKYGFLPGVKHYACMVNLLARAGYFYDAFSLINEMPFKPTKSMWGSLLSSCRAHGNLELSEFVAKKLVELEPENTAYYVLLSNLYAEMGRWHEVEQVRELMKVKGLRKDTGCSSVDSEPQEHVLLVG